MIGATIAAGLSATGVAQAIAGGILVWRFVGRCDSARANAMRPVTVLKPLHGDEPLLEEALASVCRQDYPVWQVVFGVQDPADTALPVVRRLRARFPDCDIAVVVDPDGPRSQPEGRQPDQHAAGGEARRAGDRRCGCARGAGLAAPAGRGAGGAGCGAGDDGLYRGAGPPPPAPLPRGEGECGLTPLGTVGALGAAQINHVLSARRAAGAGHGAAGLPGGHDDAAARDAGADRRVHRPG